LEGRFETGIDFTVARKDRGGLLIDDSFFGTGKTPERKANLEGGLGLEHGQREKKKPIRV